MFNSPQFGMVGYWASLQCDSVWLQKQFWSMRIYTHTIDYGAYSTNTENTNIY